MFTFTELPTGALAAIFCCAALVVLLCGTRLTRLADRFADLSGIGEAVTGALFLGALTSLPGSVTSVTAAHRGFTDLALSNAIGGIAAQTVFLVVADAAWRNSTLQHAAASVENMVSGVILLILLTILLIAEVLPPVTIGWIHPVTIVLFLVYGVGILIAARISEAPTWTVDRTADTLVDVPDEPLADGQPVFASLAKLSGFGVVVGIAGWVIAETGVSIATQTGIREGLVGALMTSVATSTPELVTTVVAVRRGALTLAVAGIFGGNTFDVLFTAFSDIAFTEGSIYHEITAELRFLVLLSIAMTAVLLLAQLRRERYGIAHIGFESFILLVLYVGGLLALIFTF